MEFYRKRIVEKPRKEYMCALCLEPITGKHIYASGKSDMDFFASREHVGCNRFAEKMCSDCSDSSGCCVDISECFREEKQKEKEVA